MSRPLLLCAAVIAVSTTVFAVPGEAEAAKVIIYHNGEDVFPTGPLPEPFNSVPKLSGVQAGYICRVFGVFWAYFHIWGCRPVGFIGHTVYTEKTLAAAVAAKYPASAMRVGLWTKHGRFVLGGAVLLLIVMAFLRKKKKDDDD